MQDVGLDEEMMRRLASALIAQWDNVPGDLQAAILREASSALDQSHRPPLEEDHLKQYIRKMAEGNAELVSSR